MLDICRKGMSQERNGAIYIGNPMLPSYILAHMSPSPRPSSPLQLALRHGDAELCLSLNS